MMNRELFHYMSSNNDITRVVVQMHKKNLGFRKAFRCPYNMYFGGGGCFKICTKNAELNYLHLGIGYFIWARKRPRNSVSKNVIFFGLFALLKNPCKPEQSINTAVRTEQRLIWLIVIVCTNKGQDAFVSILTIIVIIQVTITTVFLLKLILLLMF